MASFLFLIKKVCIFEHMKKFLKKTLRKIARWACAEEVKELEDIRFLLGGGKVAISGDIHHNTDSWAVISIKGEERDYVKFISLGRQQIREIAQFLKRYEDAGGRIGGIDASPMATRVLKDSLWL